MASPKLHPKWVVRLRECLGLKRRPFAERLGVSHTAVNDWEEGAGISPFNRIRLLALAEEEKARVSSDVLAALREAQIDPLAEARS